MEQNSQVVNDKRNGDLKIARAYQLMSLVFDVHLDNRKAARACRIQGWLWSLGLGPLSRYFSVLTLDRYVDPQDWQLVKLYADRYSSI